MMIGFIDLFILMETRQSAFCTASPEIKWGSGGTKGGDEGDHLG